MPTVADVVAQTLKHEGIERIYGLPGEQTDALLQGLDSAGIRFIPVRHEQAAALMAVGDVRICGTIAACMATVGPGALNLMTGLATATLDRVPIVAITAQTRTATQHRTYHQRIDTLSALAPVVTYNAALRVPETASEITQLAVQQALRTRGAAHIELAPDVAGAECSATVLPRLHTERPHPNPAGLSAARDTLDRAERLLVVVGDQVVDQGVSEGVRTLVERRGAAVCTTLMGKGAVPLEHPNSVGTKGFGFPDVVDVAIERADVVLLIGVDPIETDLDAFMDKATLGIVHLAHDPAPICIGFSPTHDIPGDLGASVAALTPDGGPPESVWFTDLHQALHTDLITRGVGELCHPGIVALLGEVVPKHAIVVSDVGSHKQWLARGLSAHHDHGAILSNGLASMGVGIPMGIGAAMACTRPVVVVNGDGGFWMNAAELETAVRLGINLVVITLVDQHFGLIRLKQENDNQPVLGTEFGPTDIPMAARALGAKGHFANDANALANAVRVALESGGVHVIAAPVASEQDDEHIVDITALVERLRRGQ